MGLRTPSTNGSSPFPIRDFRRNRSSSGSFSTGLGNSSSGSFDVIDRRVVRSSRRISQATLQKIFMAMMATAFCLYVIFTAYIIHLHHHPQEDINEKGMPHFLQNKQTNEEILRAHIQRLKDDRQKLSKETVLIDHARSDTSGTRIQVQPARAAAVSPKFMLEEVDIHDMKHPNEILKGPVKAVPATTTSRDNPTNRILKAYLEPVYLSDWDTKPLPVRNTTAEQLQVLEYPRVMQSCQRLPELWPIDDFPDADPFLPWIHDVFPTDNGRFIQFVAQNRRRCQTGTTPDQIEMLEQMQPQIALFQHVPIRRVAGADKETRYKLTSHEEADPDGIETRFICSFSNGQETLSVFNLNYDYVARRKHSKHTFTKEGHKDNKSIHTSQLIFQCPVPESLVDIVREGTSVVQDQATLFVTLVPIRTPPRYGAPDRYLPPKYQEGKPINFTVSEEWGDQHILPKVEDSGRWENIPICLPTWKAFPKVTAEPPPKDYTEPSVKELVQHSSIGTKKSRVVACTWASTSYATRGDRYAIDDGARRLDEWLRFHLLTGLDHIFVYDNSHGNHTLEPVTSQFPDRVTRIAWPATICNNNRTFHDSPGERSSQYAAESSCRLRFGPHTDWMASMDIDEYITPVGTYESIRTFLKDLDKANTKVIAFGSWRAWPRRDLIEPPVVIHNKAICEQQHPCFDVKVPTSRSILQTYNCDRQLVKKETMPAEKQIYRTDYVLQHFIHFSTVTLYTMMTAQETVEAGMKYGNAAPDPLLRFADEITEVTMLHTKAMATQDTAGWEKRCKGEMQGTCRIGVPYPDLNTSSTVTADKEGWLYNCYVNPKIEEFWVPRLHQELKQSTVIDFESS